VFKPIVWGVVVALDYIEGLVCPPVRRGVVPPDSQLWR
jgi:hypothetical protein